MLLLGKILLWKNATGASAPHRMGDVPSGSCAAAGRSAALCHHRLVTADHASFARMLAELPGANLESTARDYIWLAEFGPAQGRCTFELKRGLVVAECERRGRLDIIEAARKRFGAG